MVHLPSLQTLRAFEAAGRLRSYSRAAEELGLTHGAVSHRIRELEERLGRTLFQRAGNTMQMTVTGSELYVQVRQGLSLLEQAFTAPDAPKATTSGEVTITTVPSIAGTWLVARLAQFRTEHPHVEVSLRVTEMLADFKKDGNDFGIRLGSGGWSNVNIAKMFDEALSPVCTPEYQQRIGVYTPADLARATLLRNPWTPWARWFKAAGLDWPEPKKGPSFDDANLMLRSVMQGDGVALARHWLAIDEVRAGRLVYPFPHSIEDAFSYWIVWPNRRSERPAVKLLREWLLDVAANEQAPLGPKTARLVEQAG